MTSNNVHNKSNSTEGTVVSCKFWVVRARTTTTMDAGDLQHSLFGFIPRKSHVY